MVSKVIDYRVSRVVILCKDCGEDVGLYPARHKCGILSSETPPLPSIPKKYLSAGKTGSDINNLDNDHTNESLWGKLRSIRNWKDTNAEDVTDNSQNSKLWNKLLALNSNIDCDSDNESEKDEWEGETHISRILREYYENKGADLPDWLYDSDSKIDVSSKMTSNLNNTTKSGNNNIRRDNNDNSKSDNNVSRGRQPRIFDPRELLTTPTLTNFPSLPVDRRDRSRDRNVHPPDRNNINNIPTTSKKMDPKYNDRPPRPSPIVRSTSDDDGRLTHKKSHQQLRSGGYNPPHVPVNRSRSVSPNPPHIPINRSKSVNPNPLHIPVNRSRSVSPNPHQHQQFIPRDVRFNHSQYESNGHSRQRVPPSGPGRNNRQGNFF